MSAASSKNPPPSLHSIPVGDGADKLAAEQIDGRFRHIEYQSRAMAHYVRAQTNAARLGVGYLIVRPEYTDRALGYQEPRISCEPDSLKVVFDPWSTDIDGADADFAFLLSSISPKKFEKRWPKFKPSDFGDTQQSVIEDNRKSVIIAEQWSKESKTREMVVYIGADGQETSDTADRFEVANAEAGGQLLVKRIYKDKYDCINWRMMSGTDILEESIYPAEYIGIVPVYGYVGWRDGRMTYCGIPRRARSSQQAYNYHVSEQLAYIATAPRAPYWVSARAAAGHEKLLDRMSVDSRAWMPYNDLDVDGAIASPSRISPTINIGNHEAGAAQALRDIQASIGMYQANIGARSNETSGVAIDARKEQGEASTAMFPSHMAASLGQVGRIVMQMDAKLTDTPRKHALLGVDGSSGSVQVNPKQQDAFRRTPEGVSINPNIGRYGVRVVTGASYTTQRSQTNQAFAEVMRNSPEMAQVVAPFWAQTLDFPGADKFAQAMTAMAPAPVKAILQPEGQDQAPDPAAMAQQLEEMSKALQEATQIAQDAQQDADEAHAAMADAKRLAEVKERELDIKAYDSETKRYQVMGATEDQAKLVVQDLINQMLSNPDPLPGESPMPDETPMHEQAEAPQEEPMEPQGPSPEILALIEGQDKLAQAMGMLMEVVKKPRKRTPVRDPKTGDILHVTDSIEE